VVASESGRRIMALKKSEPYSSLWQSCDELRGGMDASQYKDYVLVLLFIKYVSDKYAGQPYAAIVVPEGASFNDMVALKGRSDIGDMINKKVIGPLAKAKAAVLALAATSGRSAYDCEFVALARALDVPFVTRIANSWRVFPTRQLR